MLSRNRLSSAISISAIKRAFGKIRGPFFSTQGPSIFQSRSRSRGSIAQEALANAARHAGASEVTLQLKLAGNDLELIVSDNGSGFDLERYRSPEELKSHVGLVTMAERAGLLGGSVDIDTAPGRGTRIRASLPIPVDPQLAELARVGAAGA